MLDYEVERYELLMQGSNLHNWCSFNTRLSVRCSLLTVSAASHTSIETLLQMDVGDRAAAVDGITNVRETRMAQYQ